MRGIQEVVWNAGCSVCRMRVFLQDVICSGLHSLTVGWGNYHMLIVLVWKRVGKAVVGYTDFGEATEKRSTQVEYMKALEG